MGDFRKIFPRPATFLPVIHAEDPDQVLVNTSIADAYGADGVFLINHDISAENLLACYFKARREHPDFWIGLNFLDLPNLDAIKSLPKDASGLWVDNAKIDDHAFDPTGTASIIWDSWQAQAEPHQLYFGGVAFKGQKQVEDPAEIAKIAAPFMDVVTTSGPGTGFPPDPAKIRAMKAALGDHPLAIANGMTANNILRFFGIADVFLVAMGISESGAIPIFNTEKLARMARIIHSYQR
jgi:uncharacterized protein